MWWDGGGDEEGCVCVGGGGGGWPTHSATARSTKAQTSGGLRGSAGAPLFFWLKI